MSYPTFLSACSSCSQSGGFLSHGGTPSSHPFLDGMFGFSMEKAIHPFWGNPHDYGNCRLLSLLPKTPRPYRPCLNPLSGASSDRMTRMSLVVPLELGLVPHLSHSKNLQSLAMSHHFGCARAYAMLTRVVFFPYVEQIEEGPYAKSLRALSSKWGFCLRQTRCDKAVTKIVKGGFQNGSFGEALTPQKNRKSNAI